MLFMRFVCFAIVVTLLAASSVRSAEETQQAADSEKLSAEQLAGMWKYVKGVRDGQELKADHFGDSSVVISPKSFTLKGDQTFVMDYQLKPDAKPAAIDFRIATGPFGVGATAEGIIQMKDDQLTVCYAPSADVARPGKFAAESGSGHFLFVLKREAKELTPENLVGSWKYVAGEKDGQKLTEADFTGQSVAISKEAFTLKGEGGTFVMAYEIDTRAKPAKIKFTITQSPFGAGATAAGVIQFRGEQLSVCYAPMGGTPPTELKTKAGSGHHLFLLKKQDE